MKGSIREQWGKFTDDDIDRIAGKRDQLVGHIQSGTAWPARKPRSKLMSGGELTAKWPIRRRRVALGK